MEEWCRIVRLGLEEGAGKRGLEWMQGAGKRGLEWRTDAGKRSLEWMEGAGKRGLECGRQGGAEKELDISSWALSSVVIG